MDQSAIPIQDRITNFLLSLSIVGLPNVAWEVRRRFIHFNLRTSPALFPSLLEVK